MARAGHLWGARPVEHLHGDLAGGRRDRLRVVYGVAGDREQVDAVPLQRPLLVEPGQQQQIFDEQTHAAGLARGGKVDGAAAVRLCAWPLHIDQQLTVGIRASRKRQALQASRGPTI